MAFGDATTSFHEPASTYIMPLYSLPHQFGSPAFQLVYVERHDASTQDQTDGSLESCPTGAVVPSQTTEEPAAAAVARSISFSSADAMHGKIMPLAAHDDAQVG
jgi:hypothetical protein